MSDMPLTPKDQLFHTLTQILRHYSSLMDLQAIQFNHHMVVLGKTLNKKWFDSNLGAWALISTLVKELQLAGNQLSED